MHGRRSKAYFFRCLIWTICTGTRACVASELLVYTRLIFCYGAWASGLKMCTMKWTSDFLLYWKHLFPIPFIMQCCMKQGRGFRNMKLKWALWLKNILDEASWEILFSKKSLILTCKGTKVTKVSYHTEQDVKRSSFKGKQLFIRFKFTAACSNR